MRSIIEKNANKILVFMASYGQFAGDTKAGRYSFSGNDLLKHLQLDAEDINDAIEYLDQEGLIDRHDALGTSPFSFDSVSVSTRGRVFYQRSIATEDPITTRTTTASVLIPTQSSMPNPKKVFIIHGRNEKARRAIFDFLRSLSLEPIEWSQAIHLTGQGSPYIGQVLDAAFTQAQAVIALFTGDDEARLRHQLAGKGEQLEQLTLQARPNVIFEAGMAMGRCPERTIFVEFGKLRGFSDVAGRHTVRMDNTPEKRLDLADRLRLAGCAVDLNGRDWLIAGDIEAAGVDSVP